MAQKAKESPVPSEIIESRIIVVRNEKVMLDTDLAFLYGIETKQLIRAMKRNIERFPDDFMFQLTQDEFGILRSHFGASNEWGGRRYPPYAFTENGVAMLSSVLNSKRAVDVNIQIMRTFIKLRKMLAGHEDLKREIAHLEKKYDKQFRIVFEAIRQLMEPEPSTGDKSRIGYLTELKTKKAHN